MTGVISHEIFTFHPTGRRFSLKNTPTALTSAPLKCWRAGGIGIWSPGPTFDRCSALPWWQQIIQKWPKDWSRRKWSGVRKNWMAWNLWVLCEAGASCLRPYERSSWNESAVIMDHKFMDTICFQNGVNLTDNHSKSCFCFTCEFAKSSFLSASCCKQSKGSCLLLVEHWVKRNSRHFRKGWLYVIWLFFKVLLMAAWNSRAGHLTDSLSRTIARHVTTFYATVRLRMSCINFTMTTLIWQCQMS